MDSEPSQPEKCLSIMNQSYWFVTHTIQAVTRDRWALTIGVITSRQRSNFRRCRSRCRNRRWCGIPSIASEHFPMKHSVNQAPTEQTATATSTVARCLGAGASCGCPIAAIGAMTERHRLRCRRQHRHHHNSVHSQLP